MPLSLKNLAEKLSERDLYLWGARQLGFSAFRALEREGLAPAAFLDSSPDLQGRPVLGRPVLEPGEILARPAGEIFIIITSGFFAGEISAICEKAGLVYGRDFVRAEDLQRFDYQIDVSGACNLKCISCPRGNFQPQPEPGFMSPETFKLVLDKILREDPFVGAVALYNWGEPLLHPDLPEIIKICRAKGVHAAVSSNLSLKRDLEPVVKAGPSWFRVSVSGVGQNYEVTHTGGRWPLVLENLKKLKRLREEFQPAMEVEVFYHIYQNRTADYGQLQAICRELDFPLRVRHAALAPLDNIADIIEGRPVNEALELTRSLQTLSVEEAMDLARQDRGQPCAYARCLHLTWDLRVRSCMEWYHPDLNLVPGDFLSTPIEDLARARQNSPLCLACRERALHRCYIVYGDERLIEKRGSLYR